MRYCCAVELFSCRCVLLFLTTSLTVVADLKVEELSQELDGGLRAVLLDDRHVHVVHEDHNLCSVHKSAGR